MTPERLTEILAEHIMGWSVGPDRFTMGGRRWLPRWRFQPTARQADAFRLLEAAAAEEYTSGSETDGFWAKVCIRGVTGQAHERTQPLAITVAVARAVGLEVDATE
jgi:hypothetical protein